MKCHNWECCPSPPVNSSIIYGGMFNHSGYSIQIDSVYDEKALLFDAQSPSTNGILLNPGTISLEDGSSFTPGTLMIKESGTYAIGYSVNAASNMEGECRISVYVNNALLLNSMTLQQMHSGMFYLFGRTVHYQLEADSEIQLVVNSSKPGSMIIGGNLSSLWVQKLSD